MYLPAVAACRLMDSAYRLTDSTCYQFKLTWNERTCYQDPATVPEPGGPGQQRQHGLSAHNTFMVAKAGVASDMLNRIFNNFNVGTQMMRKDSSRNNESGSHSNAFGAASCRRSREWKLWSSATTSP